MNKDQKLLAEAYEQVNEAYISLDGAIELYLFLVGGNKWLAIVLLLLSHIGIPTLVLTLLTHDKNDVKRFLEKIWNGLRGRMVLNPNDVFKAADKVKQVLKGSEKGKVTRLVNDMKFHIERGQMAEAQRIADELKSIFSSTENNS
jgi:hypothetical protein